MGGLCRVSTHQRFSSPQSCEFHSLCAFGKINKSSSATVNATSDKAGMLRNDSSHGVCWISFVTGIFRRLRDLGHLQLIRAIFDRADQS